MGNFCPLLWSGNRAKTVSGSRFLAVSRIHLLLLLGFARSLLWTHKAHPCLRVQAGPERCWALVNGFLIREHPANKMLTTYTTHHIATHTLRQPPTCHRMELTGF
ncbi:hypothetical protein B0T22DRAFT_466270 [Podospora appendiculata]|uniref:Uncharacterized protein n=1 Tax=Podospora appendiculata TaxID=314037 RepID=A0AAE0X5Y1_9PEZI|nr:hypothetical protein B0T22DRAFT_466270 [Podospora appendiculata]